MVQMLRLGRGSCSYGGGVVRRHLRAVSAAAALLLALVPSAVAAVTPVRIVAFGDSLMAGYSLPAGADYPARLEAALHEGGLDVAITNASVSGDTTSGGLERLDWSVPDGTDGVLLELGANDMLRGQDPALTRQNLAAMIERLKARHIRVYLVGMRADPTLGPDYVSRFDTIYPDLAKADDLPLYPFLLEGVAGVPKLQLADGMHPNPAGIARMVERSLPSIAAWAKSLAGAS